MIFKDILSYKAGSDGHLYEQSGDMVTEYGEGKYTHVSVRINGRKRLKLLHLLICEAFHGPKPAKGYEVDHIDTDSHNNKPENLRWVTHQQNCNNPKTIEKRKEVMTGWFDRLTVEQQLEFREACRKGSMNNTGLSDWWNSLDERQKEERKEVLSVSAKKRFSIPIVQLSDDKEFIRDWDSASDAARYLKRDSSSISKCCKNKDGFNSAYGYKWMFKKDFEKLENLE